MTFFFNVNEIDKKYEEMIIKNLIPEGKRKVEIISSSEKNTREKILYDSRGNQISNSYPMLVFKFLDLETNATAMEWLVLMESNYAKFKMACNCFGLQEIYKTEKIDATDFLGKIGIVEFKHKESEQYGKQSVVKKYINSTNKDENSEFFKKVEFINDEVPF